MTNSEEFVPGVTDYVPGGGGSQSVNELPTDVMLARIKITLTAGKGIVGDLVSVYRMLKYHKLSEVYNLFDSGIDLWGDMLSAAAKATAYNDIGDKRPIGSMYSRVELQFSRLEQKLTDLIEKWADIQAGVTSYIEDD